MRQSYSVAYWSSPDQMGCRGYAVVFWSPGHLPTSSWKRDAVRDAKERARKDNSYVVDCTTDNQMAVLIADYRPQVHRR